MIGYKIRNQALLDDHIRKINEIVDGNPSYRGRYRTSGFKLKYMGRSDVCVDKVQTKLNHFGINAVAAELYENDGGVGLQVLIDLADY
jgi:hypothetical protein